MQQDMERERQARAGFLAAAIIVINISADHRQTSVAAATAAAAGLAT